MATLIVGETPCRIPQILEIIKNSANLSLFRSNWEEFAKRLGVPGKSITELKNDLKWGVINLEGLLSDVLYTWKGNCGDGAKLSVLCQALTDCHAKDIADELEGEFAEILKAHVLATGEVCVQGQLIKVSEIFAPTDFPPGIAKRIRRNLDPIQILKKLEIPDPYESTVPLAEFIQHLVDQLDEQEVNVLEGCSFTWLFPQNLAEIMNAECDYDEDEARKLIPLEKNHVLWFVAARGLLNASLNEQQMQQILAYVFECQEVKEKKKKSKKKKAVVTILAGEQKYFKLKQEQMVEFIDWLVGNGYDLPSNFQMDWLDQHFVACLNYKNLAKHLFNMPNSRVYSLPGLLHRLVEHTMGLHASDLEERVTLVLSIIRENPGSVKSLSQNNLPPLLMRSVHVELLDLLIYAGANVNAVDEQGCNFVHRAAEYLPTDQFQQLVRYLVDHNLIHLLNTRDSEQRTPLIHLIWCNAKSDPSTLQVLASAGTDFNARDKNGETVLSVAVWHNKSVEILEALVECGADWNWKDVKNANLLHWAAYAGNLETVKCIVRLGLDVNSRDNGLLTPLMYAVMDDAKGCNVEVVKFLLESNADVNATDKNGNSALYYAQKLKQSEVDELLISKGATPLCKHKKHRGKQRSD